MGGGGRKAVNITAPQLTAALAGRYRIERELGAGGMATVYLADDLRHARKVAVKVLRPDLVAVIGSDRFLAEIRTTANLQHPNILPLFDSGEVQVDGPMGRSLLFYVMPYLEGESLRDRLTREKQLPVADAVRVASEVASALDYAHRHGVIHRDIKPENILLHDGRAHVADFGIALAASRAGGGNRMTETGMSLGTPQYMSPEQAMGEREITARSDVYALGVMTYEMLTGDPPFTGPTAQAIVAKVLTTDAVPVRTVRRSVPPHVETAVLTAIEKLPADRFATAGEFAHALAGTASRRAPVRVPAISARPMSWRAAAVAVPLLAAAYWLGTRAGSAPATASLGMASPVTWDAGLEVLPAISPDGRTVAYAAGAIPARMRIYVRPIAGGRPVALTDDSLHSQSDPRWSADGTRVLFLAEGGVFSAPAFGGAARPEVPARPANPVTSADWSPDGSQLVYTAGDTVFIRDRNGQPHSLAVMREPALCRWSPDASRIACASGNVEYARAASLFGNLSPSVIAVIRVRDGRVTQATDGRNLNQSPAWAGNDRLYFISNRHGSRDIYSVGVGPSSGAKGPVARLSAGLGAHTISLSADGRQLAYAAFTLNANIWSLPIPDRPPVSAYGATQVTHANQLVEGIAVSSDDQWIYYDSDLSGNAEIYRVRPSGGAPERLTSDPTDDFSPVPSPDGSEVAFHSWRSGNRDLFVLPLDGRPVQQVTATSSRQEVIPSWAPDGRSLAYFEYVPAGAGSSAWTSARNADGAWEAAAPLVEQAIWPTWSPDGRRLAYTLAAPGFRSRRILVRERGGDPRVLYDAQRTSGPEVTQVAWSTDARTLYFKGYAPSGEASIWGVPVGGGPARELVRFDDLARPSARPRFAVGAGRFYFTMDLQRSDVWVIEVTQP